MSGNGRPAPSTTRQVGDLAMPVLNIQGKAYAPVHVRVEAAHHDGGFSMVRCDWNMIYDIKCCEVEIVNPAGQHFIGTAEVKNGFAYSIEDMQTSALGRALGFAGFEIKTAIASADDMQAVLQEQGRGNVVEAEPVALPEPDSAPTEEQMKAIGKLCATLGREEPYAEQITYAGASRLIREMAAEYNRRTR